MNIFTKIIAALDALAQGICKHEWRPAIAKDGPARFCPLCEREEKLTDAEFYAYFGRMPRRWSGGPMGRDK